MGYSKYTIPDGTEAGYAVKAPCDASGCDATVWRGLDAMCGPWPDGRRPEAEDRIAGCGRWHCDKHAEDHACRRPACGKFGEGTEACILLDGHDGHHEDPAGGRFDAENEEA